MYNKVRLALRFTKVFAFEDISWRKKWADETGLWGAPEQDDVLDTIDTKTKPVTAIYFVQR